MILKLILSEVLGLLQATVKNPKSLASEKSILVQVRDTINQILAGIDAA